MHIDHKEITSHLNYVRSEIEEATEGKVKIKGKNYATVGLRLRCLREHFGSQICIRTKIIQNDSESITVKAEVLLNLDKSGEQPILLSDGYANKNINYVQSFLRSSLLEFCQTSAWGRALGNLGLLGDTDVIPSAEEMLLAQGETIPTSNITVNASAENVVVEKEDTDAFSG